MALVKIEDFDPNYRESFDGSDIKGMGLYSQTDEKIGTISDVLVDEEGRLRYFVVDLGFWIFGKKVLLPVGRSRIDYNADRVYAVGMTRDQAEDLPEFSNLEAIDYDYEERVRGVYRAPVAGASVSSVTDYAAPVDRSVPLEASAPLEASPPLDTTYSAPMTGATADLAATTPTAATSYNRDAYTYHQEPDLYNLNEQAHQNLRLYEERLVANKRRVKSGEVTVGKHVETETARVSVPVEKERVIIERVTPADAGRTVAPGEATFGQGEVAHVEIYEETPDIRKETVVREEVRIRKEVEQDTVTAEETLRREELDVNTEGTSVVDTSNRLPNDRI
jgi:uncharacterized protein (TIGR02271 family)